MWISHGHTREELESLSRYSMRRFYLRPQQIWQGLLNFFHVPFGRAVRYFGAGVSYFGLKLFKPVPGGTRF